MPLTSRSPVSVMRAELAFGLTACACLMIFCAAARRSAASSVTLDADEESPQAARLDAASSASAISGQGTDLRGHHGLLLPVTGAATLRRSMAHHGMS